MRSDPQTRRRWLTMPDTTGDKRISLPQMPDEFTIVGAWLKLTTDPTNNARYPLLSIQMQASAVDIVFALLYGNGNIVGSTVSKIAFTMRTNRPDEQGAAGTVNTADLYQCAMPIGGIPVTPGHTAQLWVSGAVAADAITEVHFLLEETR